MNPGTLRFATALVATAALALLAAPARAAVVTFGAASNIAADADVSTAGTYVSAFNLGAASAATVNGVVFSGTATTAAIYGPTFGSGEGTITLASAAGAKGTGNFGGGGNTYATLSPAYQSLINPTAWASGNTATVTFGNLVVGTQYTAQLWVNDGSAANAASGRTVTLSSDSGSNTVLLDTNVGNLTGGTGQFAFASFVATAATQTITITGGTNVAYLSAVSLFRASAAPGSPPQVKIMPLGDSITKGATDSGSGYRDQLYLDLTDVGASFKFVGATTVNSKTLLINAGQQYHNGYGTYRIDNLRVNLDGITQPGGGADNNQGGYWLTGGNTTGPQLNRPAVFPDIVLVQAGTNDVNQNASLATMQTRLTNLLNWFKTNRPNAQMFVAQIVPWDDAVKNTTGKNALVQQYNAWIAGAVPALGDNFHVVDLYSLFVDANGAIKSGWLSDGIHPSHTGYVAMGHAWFAAIKDYLVVSGATYKIINRNSGRAVDAVAGGTANGTNVAQWAYNGGDNQRWTVSSVGGGQYKIIGLQSGRALQVAGNSQADGANIEISDYTGSDQQRWVVSPATGGYFTLTAVHSGKVMEVAGAYTGNYDSATGRGNIDQWTANGANNTQWIFLAP